MKKVSIIIPTYNRKEFVRNAVKSALKQSYPNIEVIVVDDNSNYDISDLLRDFENKIIIIKNKKNLGSAATYNVGIKESSGEYITILNDDDLFHPRKIERQINIFNKKRNLGFVYCPIGVLIKNELFYKSTICDDRYFFKSTHQNRICITPLVKKEYFSVSGLFDELMKFHEDRDLWYRMSKNCQFSFDEAPSYIVYNFDMHRMSSEMEKIYIGKKALYEKHKNDFEDQNKYYSEFHYELAHDYLVRGYYKDFVEQFKQSIQKNPNIIKKYLKEYPKLLLGKYSFENRRIKIDKDLRDLLIEIKS